MTLACNESCFEDRVIYSPKDPNIFNDRRVFTNLCQLQKKYHASTKYLEDKGSEVQPYMRKILTTWMLQVCDEVGCSENVFPVSVNYLDRFLSKTKLEKTQLQLLGSSCLLIASKVLETLPLLNVEKLCMYTDYSVSVSELIDFETLVLLKLKWDILAVTAIDFVDYILHHLYLSKDSFTKTKKHANGFIHLSCTDHQFSQYPALQVAACSVGAAVSALPAYQNNNLNMSRRTLIDQLKVITSLPDHCLVSGLNQVESMLRSNLIHITNCSSPGEDAVTDKENSLNTSYSSDAMSCTSSADVSMCEDSDDNNTNNIYDNSSKVFVGIRT